MMMRIREITIKEDCLRFRGGQSCDKDCMKKITVKETFDACERLLS